MEKKNILIPLDNSDMTYKSLYTLQSLFNSDDVVVHLLNIVNNYEINSSDFDNPTISKEISEAILAKGKSIIPEYNVNTISLVNIGSPIASDILSVITDTKIDTVIMTKTGKGFYHNYVIGSVTSRIVKISPVPVVVVP